MSTRLSPLLAPLLLLPIAALLLAPLGRAGAQPGASTDDPLRQQAERLRAEGSYRLALAPLEELAERDLPPDEQHRVRFLLADSQWRAAAAGERNERGEIEAARERLRVLAEELAIGAGDDVEAAEPLALEVQESLGDSYWLDPQSRDWSGAWPHYQKALEGWAASSDVERARRRYLDIVLRAGELDGSWPEPFSAFPAAQLPVEVLDDAVAIARSRDDRARVHLLRAVSLQWATDDVRTRRKLSESFETAIALGEESPRSSPWLGDALFLYAQWAEREGFARRRDDGGVEVGPDLDLALELYARMLQHYDRGEHNYRRIAQQARRQILEPSLTVWVPRSFLPGSEVDLHLQWRNVERASVELYPIDLPTELEPSRDREPASAIELAGRRPVHRREVELEVDRPHLPGSRRLWLEPAPTRGAWLVVARALGADGERAAVEGRAILLVTDVVVLTKTSPRRTLVWLVDAVTGAPLPEARVSLWHWSPDERFVRRDAPTDDDGIALFERSADRKGGAGWLAAALGDRQTLIRGYQPEAVDESAWRTYVFPDRPLYRPQETVELGVLARRETPGGGGYLTPTGQELRFQLRDPRNELWAEGELVLDQFGSAAVRLEVPEDVALGLHSIVLVDERGHVAGQASVFRIEEFRRPEYAVSVSVVAATAPEPGEAGEGSPGFRLGDELRAEVDARYFFGAPVTGAEVELLVHESPWYPRWPSPRPLPWLAEPRSVSPPVPVGGGERVIVRERLRTDAEGRAELVFRASDAASLQHGVRYRVEARVTDASRREVSGSGVAVATRFPYFVELTSEHRLHRPGDRATILVRARDALGAGVRAEGRVRVTRQVWREIWVDEDGAVVEEARLRRRLQRGTAPPEGWRLRERGYRAIEVLRTRVATDADGEGRLEVPFDDAGYYRIEWLDLPPDERQDERSGELADAVRAETTLWVGDEHSRDLGYRYGGLELVIDRDASPTGTVLPVMIGSEASGRWVLLGVEGEELHESRVLRLDGQVRFVELELRPGWAPGVVLTAAAVAERQVHLDRAEVAVPALDRLLEVEVRPERERVGPGEESWLEVEVRDAEGRPAAAQVALSVVDASIYSIQEELAPDPRTFFYGTQRPHRVSTASSLDERPLVLVEEEERRAEQAGGKAELRHADALADPSPRWVGAAAPMARNEVALRVTAQEEMLTVTSESPSLGAGGAAEPEIAVRQDFRATALWRPAVRTDVTGRARLKVDWPDSLTEWRATARAVTAADRVGAGTATSRTWKELLVRLETPRFLVAGDRALLSTVVNNNGDAPIEVRLDLALDSGESALELLAPGSRTVSAAPGETRLDWEVRALSPGRPRLRAEARRVDAETSGDPGDAVVRVLPVEEHGLERLLSVAGRLGPEERSSELVLRLPAERDRDTTRLEITVQPSLAIAILDALPYLIDYPYGCVEQTLSRFVPTVVTARLLARLGLEPEAIAGRVFGGLEPGAGRTEAKPLDELEAMIERGLERLEQTRNGDGGWGWWPGGDSDPFMTAYALWSLELAREAGVKVPEPLLDGADAFLVARLVEAESRPDLHAWLLHAVVSREARGDAERAALVERAVDAVWQGRDRLTPYGRALLLRAAVERGETERAEVLLRNLENGVRRESFRGDPVTTHWGETAGWWQWSHGAVESTAFVLSALVAARPDHPLVEPTVRWLVENRRGSRWHNTRDTAIAVLALGELLERSGELERPVAWRVRLGDEELSRVSLGAGDLLRAPSSVVVEAARLRDGENRITVERLEGDGPLWLSASARFVSREEPIPASRTRIAVERRYYRLEERPTLLRGVRERPVALREGEPIASGDRLEVVLDVESANDLEYLMFEDLKPAGLEAVELLSGGGLRAVAADGEGGGSRSGIRRSWPVYRELRDRKVALFVDRLPAGRWQIRYRLRAETPGVFHALPVVAEGMYLPDVRANGSESAIEIGERRR